MSAFDTIRALLLGLREGALEHSCESCRDDADAALDALNQAEATVARLQAEVAAQDETIATLTRNLAAADGLTRATASPPDSDSDSGAAVRTDG